MSEQQNRDFYQQLRCRIKEWEIKEGANHTWAEYILLAPDLFHLLCKLALDRDVPSMDKAKLAAAIVYFVSPIDIIPEALVGPVGYADDIALAAYVLNGIITGTNEEIVLRHWAGEQDLLTVLRDILKVADDMVGSGLWRKLKKFIESK